MDRNKKRRGELRERVRYQEGIKGGERNVRGRMGGARSKTCQRKKEVKGDWV